MIRTRIIGTGSYVPPDILTNDNLSEMVDTSDEWIKTRTGICNRHIAKDMDNADMAYNAARNAVEDAHIEASNIGLIIVATSTPDYAFPNQASLVQEKLKAVNAMCFDVSAACSGFITALDIAASMLKTGSYKYALVIGSEKMSEIVNWKDRSVCVLFGDGAGAVVLKAVDNNTEDDTGVSAGHERGIIDSNIYNDGTGASVLTGGRRFSDSCSTDMFIHMDGQEVFKFAVKSVPTAIQTLLHNNNMNVDDVDKFILHQANVRIIESVAKRLKADKEKFPVNLNEYGNTSSASIPILLDELNRNGSLKQGEKLVLAGFGAGLSWGSILLVW
jgi:3-oxoacyl-[acyl-carrier-protein] synthase-3